MVGILFAIFCALVLIRLWRRPYWGPHAHGACGYGHPLGRAGHRGYGGPPWNRPPFDAERSESATAAAQPSTPSSGGATTP